MEKIAVFLTGSMANTERFGSIPAKRFHVGAKLRLPITCTVAAEDAAAYNPRPCKIVHISPKRWFEVQFDEFPSIRECFKFCVVRDGEDIGR